MRAVNLHTETCRGKLVRRQVRPEVRYDAKSAIDSFIRSFVRPARQMPNGAGNTTPGKAGGNRSANRFDARRHIHRWTGTMLLQLNTSLC